MRIFRASALLSLLGGLALSSCAGFTTKPPKPAAMPRAEKAAPFKVGVLPRPPRFEMSGAGFSPATTERLRGWRMYRPIFAQADDVGGKFVRALRASGAFVSVETVPALGFNGVGGNHDLLIEGDFAASYRQDPAMMGKAFISGFLLLLPVPFTRYDDSYTASAVLTVYDGAGRLLRKYSEQAATVTSALLFSAGTANTMAAGVDAASSLLAARLVAAIIADREGFSRAAATRPAAAAVPAPPPAAAATVETRAEESHKELAGASRSLFAAAAAQTAAANSTALVAAAPAAAAEPAVASAPAAPPPAAPAEPEPAAKAETPKPKRRGPLTPAEERAIDEELLP